MNKKLKNSSEVTPFNKPILQNMSIRDFSDTSNNYCKVYVCDSDHVLPDAGMDFQLVEFNDR